jgi:tetratricopeptide (TPR) repeat protein
MSLDQHALKRLGARDLEAAVDKAEQYRALNEPEEAESICRDVLAESPSHPRALRTLGLALTDRFAEEWAGVLDEAVAVFERLESPYERVYYAGVAWERCAKAQIKRAHWRQAAHSIAHAMDLFAEAERVGPPNTPDPILRWNRCVRAIEKHPELVEAFSMQRSHEFQHGD